MKYIFIVLSALFFLGCSPKYKVVNEYVSPKTESGKVCLGECQKQYGNCKEICKANFDICKVKADETAKANYESKMQQYLVLQERYIDDMEMYQLEIDLMYGFNGFGYGYGYGYNGYYPHSIFMMRPMPLFRPVRPRKPSLAQEIQLAEMKMCQIDCGCTKSYDNCFIGCGGEVKTSRHCIENCPSDR
jgi:hypothetical protein